MIYFTGQYDDRKVFEYSVRNNRKRLLTYRYKYGYDINSDLGEKGSLVNICGTKATSYETYNITTTYRYYFLTVEALLVYLHPVNPFY